MVRGITTTLKYTLGYFATADLTAAQLFPIFWKAVSILEMTCNVADDDDGASPNRRLFFMQAGIQGKTENDVVYYTKNLFNHARNIYFRSRQITST